MATEARPEVGSVWVGGGTRVRVLDQDEARYGDDMVLVEHHQIGGRKSRRSGRSYVPLHNFGTRLERVNTAGPDEGEGSE